MRAINTILFDLDGTLIDSKESVINAVYCTAQKFAPAKFTYQDIENRFGESLDVFINQVDVNLKKEISACYLTNIYRNHDSLTCIFPQVKETLSALKKQGIRLGIVTNKQRDLTFRALLLFDIIDYFNTIITIDDVVEGKPSPEPVLKALDLIGAKKETTLMVGDTIFDVQAAHAADIKVAVVDWYKAYNQQDILPDYHFSDIKEILSLLPLKKVIGL